MKLAGAPKTLTIDLDATLLTATAGCVSNQRRCGDLYGHRYRGGERVTCALDEADSVSRVGLVEMLRNAYIGAS